MAGSHGAEHPPIGRLSELIDRYERQLTADLWHHYHGLDLRDLFRPGGGASRLTWRLLDDLIDGLPGESAFKTAVRDTIPDGELAKVAKQRQGHGRWSHTDLLLASIHDAISALRVDVYRSRGAKATYPEPWPRPGVVSKSRTRALTPAGRAYLQRMRDEHARLHPAGADEADSAGG